MVAENTASGLGVGVNVAAKCAMCAAKLYGLESSLQAAKGWTPTPGFSVDGATIPIFTRFVAVSRLQDGGRKKLKKRKK